MSRDEAPKTTPRAPHEVEQAMREKVRRNAIDAAHFFGLAALYEERGKRQQAAECLEIARRKNVVNPFVHKLHGKILFRRRAFNAAAAELRLARRYNPFDRETAELLGRVEYERERFREALEATIDAFLLVEESDRDNGDRLKKRIRTLKTIQRMTSPDLAQLFRERRDKLQTAFDRLEWQREQLLREIPDSADATTSAIQVGGHLRLANRLRKLSLWSELTDDQIFHLSRATREERHAKGQKIFEYGSTGADIYALEEGAVGIYRPTHYGTYHLGTLPPGSVFGEVNFISHGKRSGDAVAVEDCRILRLDAQELELVIERQPELGVRIYSLFWQDLARKLRGANEQLRTFFSADAASENFVKMRRAERGEAGAVEVRSDDKIELLREQGLSGSELTTLANFSDVKRFRQGAYLFHEGDPGEEMYAVLDGQVMITKFIDGGGEEALAILGRGDFFGEMALIDGEPRSADAKAYQGETTVIAFDNDTLKEVMSMDPVAALDFMKLLCRLISKRLREIDEKVVGWRIMSGARPAAAGFFVEGPVPRAPATTAR
ncbi:MAG TPA: cyclic nucleotide-binding domain-containing protein [Thermoanaerobaculia bacterium]|jgi:CRP-like cAMP-binding protein